MESFNDYSICVNCGNVIHYTVTDDSAMWTMYGDSESTGHVRTHPNEYRSHKFSSIEAEILWQLSLESAQSDDLGESNTFGWYALFRDFSAILMEDCCGNVSADVFERYTDCEAEWERIADDYDEWAGDNVTDWREADRTEDGYDDYLWDYRY